MGVAKVVEDRRLMVFEDTFYVGGEVVEWSEGVPTDCDRPRRAPILPHLHRRFHQVARQPARIHHLPPAIIGGTPPKTIQANRLWHTTPTHTANTHKQRLFPQTPTTRFNRQSREGQHTTLQFSIDIDNPPADPRRPRPREAQRQVPRSTEGARYRKGRGACQATPAGYEYRRARSHLRC